MTTTPTDPTTFGVGGDHCPHCGSDWKRPCDEDCTRNTSPALATRLEWQGELALQAADAAYRAEQDAAQAATYRAEQEAARAADVAVLAASYGTCDSHPAVHAFRNDPDPCYGWLDYPQAAPGSVATAELDGYRVALYRDPNTGDLRLDMTNPAGGDRYYEVNDDATLEEL